jgi:fatty-acyl-CoA synthase
MLESTMMDYPLTIPLMLERAKQLFPHVEVVSLLPGAPNPDTKMPTPFEHRTNYGEIHTRVMKLCNALVDAGVQSGDRVATMALNSFRHLELYFAVPSVGAVCHMINIRLPPEQIGYIINHAQDKVLFIDNVFAAQLPMILQHCPSIQKVIVMGQVPGGVPIGVHDFEDFIRDQPVTFTYPELDERQASGMCYTSGTTGNPKGVLYSHRGIVLHSLASMGADLLGVSSSDTVLPVVPMFHVNAWGYPYTCTWVGAKQVYTGMFTDPKIIAHTLVKENVTMTAGVPTIWIGLLDELDKAASAGTPYKLEKLKALVVGGSSTPRKMLVDFEVRHKLKIIPAWGMTETTPLGTANILLPQHMELDDEARWDQMTLSGRQAPLVDLELVDGDGLPLPHDGEARGRLLVRGPWVTKSYYNNPEATATTQYNGWFDTGDIATMNAEGFMMIQDRAKDLIKSGGEWISSVDLENELMGHPAVKEAAVIGLPHPKWDERPLGVIVLREGSSANHEELNAHLAKKFAKWMLPDDYVFTDKIPLTTTGKFLKRALRDQFKDHKLPGA